MRIPTLTAFNAQMQYMTGHLKTIATYQEQIASGKKLKYTSDAPVAGGRIKATQNFISRIESYSNNSVQAKNRTASMDSNIAYGIQRVERAMELIRQAKNDTLNDKDRQNIAVEMRSVKEDLLNLANMQDSSGEYIFSGHNIELPPYVFNGGRYEYQGSSEGLYVEIGEGVRVLHSDSGYRVFGDIKSGNGTYSIGADSANTGSGVIHSATPIDNTLPSDSYTIEITENSGVFTYEVLDSTGAVIVPVPPAAAPEYNSGETIQFNGLATVITGVPANGDKFVITPSKSQSIFETLDQLANALEIPQFDGKAKADFRQVMNEQHASLQGAFNHMVLLQTETGNRARKVENQIEVNEQLMFDKKELVAQLSNTDLSQTISELTQQLGILQISQQSYAKIQDTLFNLLIR